MCVVLHQPLDLEPLLMTTAKKATLANHPMPHDNMVSDEIDELSLVLLVPLYYFVIVVENDEAPLAIDIS